MTLYDNEREDNPEPIPITIHTRVPSKWRFVDMETGDVWMPHDGQYQRAFDIAVVSMQELDELVAQSHSASMYAEWHALAAAVQRLPASAAPTPSGEQSRANESSSQ